MLEPKLKDIYSQFSSYEKDTIIECDSKQKTMEPDKIGFDKYKTNIWTAHCIIMKKFCQIVLLSLYAMSGRLNFSLK